MNRLHAMALIQRTVLDGALDVKDVWTKLRNEIPATLMLRTDVEAFATHSIQLRDDARFPVEKARMALDIREAELRADILDALGALDVSDPRDCREIYEVHRALGSSIGEHSLRQGIDALEAAGKDFEALRARLDEIYPSAKSEDE